MSKQSIVRCKFYSMSLYNGMLCLYDDLFSSNYYYLLLNRTRSTEYSMKINKL